ncbi:MAG TPA: nitrilase family protein [Alphaproteobacteria bacterium]|nr:nitrilase family protein [Alphaproteobacteria bacterium]
MTRIRAASAQFQHRPSDKAYNLGRIDEMAADAAARGMQIVVFPEMCITGYWHVTRLPRPALEALAEPVPDGPSVERLRGLARRYGMIVGAGLLERGADGRLFNAYVACLPDGTVHCHRKLHAFESDHISSGDRYTVFDTHLGAKLGILICWDNNLVENVRATALLGADILLAPHQTGGCLSRSPEAMGLIDPKLWQNRHADPAAIEAEFRGPKGRGWLMRWLPARAHDNGLFLIFSNGVGQDEEEVRTGNAMILDPYGRILAETGKAGDDLVTAELDLGMLPLCTGRRWIRGRRPELYGLLTERSGDELDPRRARFSTDPVVRS